MHALDPPQGATKMATALPFAEASLGVIEQVLKAGRRLAVFLDYDGTLTPIVAHPEDARLDGAMREAVARLAEVASVAVVSGRDRSDVAGLVGLPQIAYAGSHGFDILSPGGKPIHFAHDDRYLRALDNAEAALRPLVERIPGAHLERKKFGLVVHYRRVAEEARIEELSAAVARQLERLPALRRSGGKKIIELRPALDWDKGKAVLWLLDALHLAERPIYAVYMGDDETDEDAFAALADKGLGILVGDKEGPTRAAYRLQDPEALRRYLEALSELCHANR
jgi:trehalose 6-phosphate phosphatase